MNGNQFKRLTGMFLAGIMLFAALGLNVWAAEPAAANTSLPKPDKTVVVVLENQSYQSVIGNPKLLYINYLASQGTVFKNAFAVERNSQPNFLDLFSGSNQGATNDFCPNTYNTANLASELLRTNQTFAGYSEDLPAEGSLLCISQKYNRKNNPWVNFNNVPKNLSKPLTAFPTDFSKLPTVSFVIPNMDNNMSTAVTEGADKWLDYTIGEYVRWAMQNNSLLILTFDEDDGTKNNQIPLILVGPMVKQAESSEQVNHYNVLRTLTDMYGLTPMENAAKVKAIQSAWIDLSDKVAPSAPSDLKYTHRATGVVTLNWKAAMDENRVVAYDVYRNGASLGRTVVTSFTDYTVPVTGVVTYEVVAIDSAGNRSTKSTPVLLQEFDAKDSLVATIYYRSNEKQWVHYSSDGVIWTQLPGYEMQASPVTGYQWIQLWTGSAKGIAGAAFHNAANAWDSNGGKNYVIPNGVHTIENGKWIVGAPVAAVKDPEVTVYYKSDKPANIHYTVDGINWTKAPGMPMKLAYGSSEWYTATIIMSSATKPIKAAFNDGTTWNSNGGKDFTFGEGTHTVTGSIVYSGLPVGYVPTPSPTPSPTPAPSASPVPAASVSPSPSASVTPEPTVTPSPTPEPTATPVPTPTATPEPTPTATPEPTPTATPVPVVIATPTAKPVAKPTVKPVIKATVYYQSSAKVTASYKVNPKAGVKAINAALKASPVKGYQMVQITLPTAASKAVFTFTAGKVNDSNKGKGYVIGAGTYTIKGGKLTVGAPK